MIYPARAAILATAAGAPLALVVAVLAPGRWYAGLAWPLAVLALTIADALAAARPGHLRAELALEPVMQVGTTVDAEVSLAFAGRPPRRAEAALAHDPLLAPADDGRVPVPLARGRGKAAIGLTALRRGRAHLDRLWVRWPGPLGLMWVQRTCPLDRTLAILPDVRPVRDEGARIFRRQQAEGLITQAQRGEGSEFESLVEFRQGMDRRAIDWKQSARHTRLHAREVRPDRNATVVLAIDAGRQMCEAVEGVPRIDRAVSAALLAAWVALKLGDRVSLYSFDARPRVASGTVAGARAFPLIQRLAADIAYSEDETNYTLALTTLAGRLDARALVVLFTEFTDPTNAEFMVRASARLAATHLLMVVVLVDEELETIAAAPPGEPDDVARAVTAAGLLRERAIVLTRLRHNGIHVVESPHDQVPERLVEAYLDIKRRNLL